MKTKNYAVMIKDNGYPFEKGTICTLIGIYPSKKASNFIQEQVKKKENTRIIIEPTSHPCTSTTVDNYLKLDNDK